MFDCYVRVHRKLSFEVIIIIRDFEIHMAFRKSLTDEAFRNA